MGQGGDGLAKGRLCRAQNGPWVGGQKSWFSICLNNLVIILTFILAGELKLNLKSNWVPLQSPWGCVHVLQGKGKVREVSLVCEVSCWLVHLGQMCESPAGYPRRFPGRGRGENGIFLG